MPKPREIDVLYGNFTVEASVPSTYEEGDALVGEVGGVLDGFIADCAARNFLPRLYKNVSAQLVTKGHKKTKTGETKKKDGTVVDVLESDISHIGRVHDEGDETVKESIGMLLISTASSIPFYKAGERTGGGGKVSQSALDASNNAFAEGEEKVEQIASVIEEQVPSFKVARDAENNITPEALARGIQALDKRLRTVAVQQRMQLLGATKGKTT